MLYVGQIEIKTGLEETAGNGSGQKRIEQTNKKERFGIRLKFLVVFYSVDVLGIIVVVVANTVETVYFKLNVFNKC